jgi:hypothetical protein
MAVAPVRQRCESTRTPASPSMRVPPQRLQRLTSVLGRGRARRHGVDSIWRDDVLPCRTYLRHCVLAAKGCVATFPHFHSAHL